jgi:hypothetical protein
MAISSISAVMTGVSLGAPGPKWQCTTGQGDCTHGTCCHIFVGEGVPDDFCWVENNQLSPICVNGNNALCPTSAQKFPCMGTQYFFVAGAPWCNPEQNPPVGPNSCPVDKCQ